jgi:hypothetical protein
MIMLVSPNEIVRIEFYESKWFFIIM